MTLTRRALLALPLPLFGLTLPAKAAPPLDLVASFSILADLAIRIGGPRVRVTPLVGPGQDAHGFEPRPSDARALANAGLVLLNGRGLDSWAARLVPAKTRTVTASTGIAPLGDDPHAWQDATNTKSYIATIRDALIAADPEGAETYRANATRYLTEIEILDRDIRETFAPIPRARRKIVTSHDAFAYYGRAYGIDVLAPQGIAADSEPSAKQLAALIAQIRRDHITALFIENIGRNALLETVARETGVHIGGQLFSDALTPSGGPASTYLAMMRHNTAAIAAALK